MQLHEVFDLLSGIQGVTFASLDAVTVPKPGVECRITNEQVLLYQNKNVSGYEQLVRRRLEEAGKDPDSFNLSDLPWGERIEGTPVIEHKGRAYLQCIVNRRGEYRYYIAGVPVSASEARIYHNYPNQGLSPDKSVYVHTYRIENITRLTLLGETRVDERIRGTLSIWGNKKEKKDG